MEPHSPNTQIPLRTWLLLAIPVLLLLIASFYIAALFIRPTTPQRMVISTSAANLDYYAFAKQYAKILAANGIEVEVLTSPGSSANLQRLLDADTDVQVAFVRSGLDTNTQNASELLKLAAIAYEPLWVFYRSPKHVEYLAQLQGKKLAVGAPDSETRDLVQPLLSANGLDTQHTKLVDMEGEVAAAALLSGSVDAAFLVASADEPMLRNLLAHKDIKLLNIVNADAQARRVSYLTRLTVPRSSIDLAADLPNSEVNILAAPMNIVVREDLHPSLQYQLLQAMRETHRGGGILYTAGNFPSLHEGDFPISPQARRYFKEGLPFLQRSLPFWIADRIEQFWVLVVPLLAIVVPLVKILPPLYSWSIRSRFFRHYGELRYLEDELESTEERANIERIHAQMLVLEAKTQRMSTPLSYSDLLYNFRMHLNLVRNKIDIKLGVDEQKSQT